MLYIAITWAICPRSLSYSFLRDYDSIQRVTRLLFLHSFTHSLIHSFTHSLIHSFITGGFVRPQLQRHDDDNDDNDIMMMMMVVMVVMVMVVVMIFRCYQNE